MWFVVGIKAKLGSNPFIKCATPFPLILWHPYARHHYFCVMTEKEQKKWHAVLQDCVRHCNNGKSLHRRGTTQTAGVSSCLRTLTGKMSSCLSHCWHFCQGRVCVFICVCLCVFVWALHAIWVSCECEMLQECCVYVGFGFHGHSLHVFVSRTLHQNVFCVWLQKDNVRHTN